MAAGAAVRPRVCSCVCALRCLCTVGVLYSYTPLYDYTSTCRAVCGPIIYHSCNRVWVVGAC